MNFIVQVIHRQTGEVRSIEIDAAFTESAIEQAKRKLPGWGVTFAAPDKEQK